MAIRSMKRAIIPLVSSFVFVISNGFFITFVGLFLKQAGYSAAIVGSMTAAFYAGLAVASLGIENVIAKVGHIRAFSALVSGLAVTTLAQGLWVNAGFWLVMRFFSGFFTAGLFVVIESWLLLLGTKRTRSKLLAFYMISLYAGQSLGQFLINIDYVDPLLPYVIAAMLCSTSLIPMALMRLQAPRFEEPSRLHLFKLLKISSSGVFSCFCSGLVLASIYGLMPIFLLDRVHELHLVSVLMALVIFGGMSLQYPIGRLSDYIERRIVLILIAVGLTITTIPLFLITNIWLLSLIIFLFGGLSFTIYPVGISLACDSVKETEIVAATQGLLLAYSIGCVFGPLLSSACMHISEFNGYLGYFIVINIILIIFLSVRRVQKKSVPQEEQFLPVPQTTPIAAELDPRG